MQHQRFHLVLPYILLLLVLDLSLDLLGQHQQVFLLPLQVSLQIRMIYFLLHVPILMIYFLLHAQILMIYFLFHALILLTRPLLPQQSHLILLQEIIILPHHLPVSQHLERFPHLLQRHLVYQQFLQDHRLLLQQKQTQIMILVGQSLLPLLLPQQKFPPILVLLLYDQGQQMDLLQIPLEILREILLQINLVLILQIHQVQTNLFAMSPPQHSLLQSLYLLLLHQTPLLHHPQLHRYHPPRGVGMFPLILLRLFLIVAYLLHQLSFILPLPQHPLILHPLIAFQVFHHLQLVPLVQSQGLV